MVESDSKVSLYGVEKRVLSLLENNASYVQVANEINTILSDTDKTITDKDVEQWVDRQTDEFNEELRRIQYKKLTKQVFNMERNAISIREKSLNDIETLIKSDMDNVENLTPREKSELSKVIMKRIYIQESAEKLAGVGNKERNYGNVTVNIEAGVLDRMREISKSKDKIIDIKYRDVSGAKETRKDKRKRRAKNKMND